VSIWARDMIRLARNREYIGLGIGNIFARDREYIGLGIGNIFATDREYIG
jgi:MFS superfamily sulfate permease-like transporter